MTNNKYTAQDRYAIKNGLSAKTYRIKSALADKFAYVCERRKISLSAAISGMMQNFIDEYEKEISELKKNSLFMVEVERYDIEEDKYEREIITFDKSDLANAIGCGENQISDYFTDYKVESADAHYFHHIGSKINLSRKEWIRSDEFRFTRTHENENVEIEVNFLGKDEDGEPVEYTATKQTSFSF